MRFLTGEVAPLVPLLIPIGTIIVWAVALAFCLLVVYIAQAFFGVTGSVLGKLPVVGGWINSSLHSIEHKITSTMGRAAESCDERVGAAFHQLARVIDWMGHEIAAHANLLQTLATVVLGPTVPFGVAGLFRRLIGPLRAAEHRAEVALRHALTAVREGRIGIGHDVLPRVRAIERTIGRELSRERARARAAEGQADHAIANLWRWTRTHTLAAGSLAFTAAVVTALGRLGMGWLRCPSFLRIGRKLGCGGFGALEDVLFTAGEALLVTDICAFSAVAQSIAGELVPVLIELVDVENALVGCHGATAPPPLAIGPLSLPAVIDPLPLAA